MICRWLLYKHTGVGDAAALTQYASAKQIVYDSLQYVGTSSGQLTPTPLAQQ